MSEHFSQMLNRHRAIPLIVLLCLGFLGNYFRVSLFFGIDFVFGSIATMLILFFYGRTWGIISALIAGSFTVLLWRHPYAIIALVGEAIFVGTLANRFRSNLILACGVYWIAIGLPFIYISYRFGLEMDHAGSMMAAIKQATNGVMNAVTASLIIMITPLRRRLLHQTKQSEISLFHLAFGTFVTAAVFPLFLILIREAQDLLHQAERDSESRLETISTGISLATERWIQQHINAATLLDKMSEDFGVDDVPRLQRFTEEIEASWNDIRSSFVTDRDGTVITAAPRIGSKGNLTVGLNFSDREYFTIFRNTDRAEPYVSSGLRGRGIIEDAVVVASAPIRSKNKFMGIAVAVLNLNHLTDLLKSIRQDKGYTATLIDSSNKVIASTDPNLKRLSHFPYSNPGVIEERSNGTYFRWPSEQNLSPMLRWKHAHMGMTSSIDTAPGWKLVVEVPMAPQQVALSGQYIQSMSVLLAFLVLILVVSLIFADRIANPIRRLSNETTNLPERMTSGADIQWPKGTFLEFDVLVTNFKSMIQALHRRFEDLRETAVKLDTANASLQEQVVNRERIANELREKTRIVELVSQVGLALQSGLDLEKIVQTVTDTSTQLSNAQFGAFFYNVIDQNGESYTLYSVSGIDRDIFSRLPMPRNTKIFGPTFKGERIVRHADITRAPEFGQNHPFNGMPPGHPPVRSYLAVPVISSSGETIGGLFFGHEESDVFTESTEKIIAGIAAQAAVAIDNARLYSHAQTTNRLKDEFLATLSHELRTPLNIILGNAELLKIEETDLSQDALESIDAIYRNAKSQNQLISDLLDISAIISGKMSFTPVLVSPQEVVMAASDSLRFSASSKGIQLDLEIDDTPCQVFADPTRLQQVVWNLLSNAVKFTPQGGSIRLDLTCTDSRCIIRVKDSGRGIEPSFLPYVFERFRQEDSTVTRRFGGLGLGLSIVKQLVELHGGVVEVNSRGKDQGSTFTVSLPLATSSQSATPAL